MTVDERIEQLRIECDNYDRALQALKALTHELLWDRLNKICVMGGVAHFGRRMHTSAANRFSPRNKVTPDLVGQRTPETGFIVEVKASVPENEEHRRSKICEVQKYDDDLTGWVHPIETHDVLFLVDYSNSPTIRDDIRAMQGEGRWVCTRPFALISFCHQERAGATWIALQLIDGTVSDSTKHATLSKICNIHPENLEANPLFGRVQIYDACPPLPLLMLRLYEAVNSNLGEEDQVRLRTEGQMTKTLSLAELKAMLADYCCPQQADDRVPKLPQTAWIKSAIRMWVEMEWVIRSADRTGCYDIIIKKTRRAPFDQFLRVCAEADTKRERKREKETARKQKDEQRFREQHSLFVGLFATPPAESDPAESPPADTGGMDDATPPDASS